MAGGFWNKMLGRAAGQRPEPVAASTESAGLARYELGVELGRGAMAVVHQALDTQTQQQVAVKRLHLQRDFAAEDLVDVRARFMREASAVRHLQHPDILQVLDAGESTQGAWIVMDLARGQDLSHFTRPGRLLPVREVLQIAARLARALHYAHSQGVVHRDIKPANVMLDRSSLALKIMDFGIARIADGTRTRTGLVLGTPSFMSPEQLAGLKVDGRSDLYSLGVLLYQLLTGRLPHQSDSMAALMNQIANQAPPDVRHFRPELPESLALVLALALEKRPELRYANGEQFAQDLELILPQLPADVAPAQALPGEEKTDPAFAQTLRLKPHDPGENS
ncbi:serine/threonine-protein kinase [Paucibacter sp. APW11]|uniref:Serine/threonine-protein kinase n=1 Tax=Roseateles aquae TaxID=3077235 RepID=A0ABU3PF74_9BURK|nr:serine/threonine-protein kinase [Paucibacter sp. APW11]MDT9001010.1 serine/threonine-protein kinase [Paucibacter sp. APW11]